VTRIDRDRQDLSQTRELLNVIAETVDRVAVTGDVLHAAVTSEIEKTPSELPRLEEIEHIYDVVRSEFSKPNMAVLGMGFLANPDAFGARAGMHWWYTDANELEPRKLRVETQPGHLEFYDYTTTSWWTQAVDDDALHASGPYVDYSGTNAYVVTFSRSVRRESLAVGVVALDVLVGKLQSIWQSQLLRLPKPTSVIDRDGVVIATNAGRLLGATLQMSQTTKAELVSVPKTNWSIAIGY
jgi:hypothetical protein